MSVDQNEVFKALREEALLVGQKVTAYHLLGERIFVIGIGLTGVAGTFAVVNDQRVILLILPFALALVTIYQIYINTEVYALAAYKSQLEERVNTIAGEPLFLWETRLARYRHNDLPAITLRIMVTLVLAMAIALGVMEIVERSKLDTNSNVTWEWELFLFVVGTSLGIVGLTVAYAGQRRVARRILNRASELMGRSFKV